MTTTPAIRAYVAFMMAFTARGLCAASRVDDVVRGEAAGLPAGFSFEMGALPNGPTIRLRRAADGTFVEEPAGGERPHLGIRFKHLRHAFVSLTFQESTSRSFADDRMLIDGDPVLAVRMQRILDRFLFLTLPALVAVKALKRMPDVGPLDKARAVARLGAEMAKDLVTP
jgi:hypothetical protein